jgi:hypothetical protein
VPGKHAQAGKKHTHRLVSRLGAFPPLVAAATFAIIGLDWGGVLIALLIVAGVVITGLRGVR